VLANKPMNAHSTHQHDYLYAQQNAQNKINWYITTLKSHNLV